jgi:uncharacterized protein YbjQ (UPF0145 family)
MRFIRVLVTLTTVGVASALFFASPALAVSTFHRGACGDGTTSITQGVDSLTGHGNLAVSASFMGFSAVNGSLKAQMKNGLVMGEVAQATWMKNRGCSGGRYFNAKNRLLTKGEKAATRRPANIEPRKVCVPHAKGCKRITIVVRKAFPTSCWNGDSNRVLMWLWVRSPSKPVKPKHPVKKLVSATATATVTIPVAASAASAASSAAAAACPGNTAAAASAASAASATVVASVSASVTETATGATYKKAYKKAYDKALKEANKRAQELAADAVASAASAASSAAAASCSVTTPPPVTPPPANPQPAPVCFGSAAHLQVGGDVFLYCEVVVPSGATIAGETMQKVSGPSDATVNGLIPSDVRWDLTPCPAGRQCYRAHLWAGSTLGDLVVEFKVSAIFSTGSTTNGSTEVTVPIRPEVVF